MINSMMILLAIYQPMRFSGLDLEQCQQIIHTNLFGSQQAVKILLPFTNSKAICNRHLP
ncbi:MAG: hypothetical protein HRT36_09315 [Alphaproteobacteria bacterium]|nr:hypothetical protein [Alphaproteobacteria bacterium]